MHRCPNRACPSRGLETLNNWVMARWTSRAWGSSSSGGCGNEGLLRSMPDLYRLTAEQLMELDGYAEISARNAIEAIALSKQQPFSRVLFGLNIPDVGWVTARNLARHFGDVDSCSTRARRRSRRSTGSGPTAPRRSPAGSRTSRTGPRRRAARARAPLRGRRGGEAGRGSADGQPVRDHGTLEGFTRDEAAAALASLGAKVSDNVSKKTTGVFVGENPGLEGGEGAEGGRPILSEADLRELVKDAPADGVSSGELPAPRRRR